MIADKLWLSLTAVVLNLTVSTSCYSQGCPSGGCCCSVLGENTGGMCRDPGFCSDAGAPVFQNSNCGGKSAGGDGSCAAVMTPIPQVEVGALGPHLLVRLSTPPMIGARGTEVSVRRCLDRA